MKDLRKRVLSLLLAVCMVLTLMPAMAFATDASPDEADIDAIIQKGIDDVNAVLTAEGYAELSALGADNTVTVSIKDAGQTITSVKEDILETLVAALVANKGTVKQIVAKEKTTEEGQGLITLEKFAAADKTTQDTQIKNFVLQLGLQIDASKGIGTLAGQSATVKVTGTAADAKEISYTIEFVPDIDAVIEQGIEDANAAIEKAGGYATLSDLDKTGVAEGAGGTVTVTLNAKASGVKLTTVQDDIIDVLVDAIADNASMLTTIDNEKKQGTITLSEFVEKDKTGKETATGTFVLGLGLKGDQEDGQLGTNTLLGVLPGQECEVTVTGKGANSADITAAYTIKFDLDFDSIIAEGIDAVNTAIAEKGSYATLKPLAAQTVTVSISNGNKRVGDVYDDVIVPLVTNLAKYSDLVKEIQEDNDTSNKIELKDVTGKEETDRGLIIPFVTKLELLGPDVTAADLANATLDQLYGKEFTVLLTSAGMGERAPYKSYTVKFEEKQPDPVVPGTGYIPPTPTTKQEPTITGDSSQVDWKLSEDGSSLTITPKDGYEITDVTVNGVSKGAVNSLSGLKTGDQVVITSRKILTEEEKAEIERLRTGVENTKIILHSKAAKKGIRLDWTKAKGFKVDYYEVFKSLKRYSGFGKAAYYKTTTGSKTYYINTKELERGTRYYYKVRGVRSFADGTTAYTQWSTKAWRKSRVTR